MIVGIDDIAPVQIAPAETLDQHLRRRHVGGEGDAVAVAEAGDLINALLGTEIVRVTEIEDEVDLVVCDAGADLLAAALVEMFSPVASLMSFPVVFVAQREWPVSRPQ